MYVIFLHMLFFLQKKEQPKKKHSYRKKDPEQEERQILLEQKKAGHKVMLEELNRATGDERRRLASKLAGVEFVPKQDDPTEEKKRKIRQKVVDMALERIGSDEELAERFVEAQISEIIGEPDRRRGRNRETGEGGMSLLEALDEADELKERLGVDKEGGGFSGVLKTLIENNPGILQTFFGKVLQPIKYIVETESGLREINPQQYKQLLEQRERAKLQSPAPPVVEEESPQIPRTETMPSGVPPVPPAKAPSEAEEQPALAISEWLPYLDGGPEVFIEELLTKADEDDAQAQMALAFLRAKTADEIIELLLSFRDKVNAQAREVIERLDREWLEGAIAYLKSLEEE